jgi:hypothetical protein
MLQEETDEPSDQEIDSLHRPANNLDRRLKTLSLIAASLCLVCCHITVAVDFV